MSHLVEEYAKACGVKIGKPIFYPLFYPIPFKKYISIHHGTCPATTYKYWSEVIELISPILAKKKIKIVQILDGENQEITLADKHVHCSKKQANFIIKNSECFIGVDSIYSNFAGENAKPLVMLFSHTNPLNTQPWRILASKTVYLSRLEEGNKPSYDPNESPRTIDSIKPEEIAESVLKVLGFKNKIQFETLFIGERYKDRCFDVIPTQQSPIVGDIINVRMDIHHNEENLRQILTNNFAEVTLSNPISDDVLFMRKISFINYISDEFDPIFVAKVKSLGINLNLLCVSKEKLASQRLLFFDYDVLFHDLETNLKNNHLKLKDFESKKIKAKSNKKIIIGESAYPSYIEATGSKELFLLDLDWMYLYTYK